ncbi:putative low complexity protein [Cryptosporidium felis]|nr:putative low complexity protein [Cryptosporidium felis]
MDIGDVIWIIINGLKNKESFLCSCTDADIKQLIENINIPEELRTNSHFHAQYFTLSLLGTEEYLDFFNSIKLSLDNSPHKLRTLICNIVESMLLEFSDMSKLGVNNKYLANNASQLMKLDLFPFPYTKEYILFMYLYRLKIICTEKYRYNEWHILLSKLNLLIEHNKAISVSGDLVVPENSFKNFFLTELKRNISILDYLEPESISRIFQNRRVFGEFSKIASFFNGIILMKTKQMRGMGELQIVKSMQFQSSPIGSGQISGKIDQNRQLSQNDLIFQITCLLSVSMNNSDYKLSYRYINYSEALINILPESNMSVKVTLRIYVLISKIYLLLFNINSNFRGNYLNYSKVDRFDSLPYLIISKMEQICSQVASNIKYLQMDERHYILKQISECFEYVIINHPSLLLFRSNYSEFNKLCNSSNNYEFQEETYSDTLIPINHIFSYVNRIPNKECSYSLFEIHSTICWECIIPNFLLCYSDEKSIYCDDILTRHLFFSQLADQLLSCIKLFCGSFTESINLMSKDMIAEAYLFLGIYSFLSSGEIHKVTEYIELGLETLELCCDSFKICSIKCMFAYLNLLVHLKNTSDDSNIELQLINSINNCKLIFIYECPEGQKWIQRKKFINFILIQVYTLMALLNGFNGIGVEEIKMHIQFENEIESRHSKEFSYNGDSSVMSKFCCIIEELGRGCEK